MALVLLLLPRERAAARHAVCVPAARAAPAAVAVAVRCPACGSTSINLVTPPHVDVPFHSDAQVGVIAHVFEEDALRTLDALRAELDSATFDEKRLVL